MLNTIKLSTLFAFTVTLAVSPLAVAAPQAPSKSQATAKPQAVVKVESKDKSTKKTEEKEPVLKLAPEQTAVYVEKMHCAHCAKKIVRKVIVLKGVKSISTDVKANLAIVTPQQKKQVKSADIWKACQTAGFQPVKLIGPEGTFAADKKTKGPLLVAKPQAEKKTKEATTQKSAQKVTSKPMTKKS